MEHPTPPLLVSGDSPDALAAAADRLREEAASAPEETLRDLRHRSLTTVHAHRRGAVLATDRDGLLRGLTALAQGRPGRDVLTGTADVAREPVLVFPGQGASWPGMAAELRASSPGFQERVEFYGRTLSAHLDGWDPADALAGEAELTRLGTVQPVQFALSSALADTWRAHGLKETAVVGHSVGEIAAAHACGAVAVEDAARLLAQYGSALTRIEGRGAMASVAASVDRVEPLLGTWGGRLDIAAVNSARNVTVSGDPDAVDELLAQLTGEGLWAWKVPGIEVAGHSRQTEILRELMLGQAPPAAPGPLRAAFYSTATGSRLAAADLTAAHWYRSMRGTVLFEQAVRALVAAGHRLFIEVSAHPTLTTVIGETLRSEGVTGVVIPTLDHRRSDRESLLRALTHAYVNGVPVDWGTAYEELLTPAAGSAPGSAPAPVATPAPVVRPQEPEVPPLAAEFRDTAELRDASPAEQRAILVELIARETDRARGQAESAESVASSGSFDTLTFLESGLTSLTVVELAGALSAATGLDLPATLVYDHSTPLALADRLRHELGLTTPDEAPARPVRRTATDEPIAIVGIGCRFPGGVTSAESLWDLVLGGRDGIGEHPGDRGWDTDHLYDPNPGELGKISSRYGGFLYDAADFDAGFFGLSPREATAMEPQQRLLLEVSWEAVEHAGIVPESLRGTRTGVFAGVISQEYGPRLHQAGEEVAGHAFLGTALCVASGRISYLLGLEGPAITLDTACSSSLVAIHQACQALRAHDCDLALAGGATVMSGPGVLVDFSRQRVLAPDGRCKAFSASADGIGLAEGVGMVLLERLSDARANGHPVLAVIRGSAVNQDGASNGLSAPSGSAQQQVVRHALVNAGLGPHDIDAIEAHGTGTPLGDPIEAHALLATYGQRPAEQPVWLGSVKSNLGHTQAAAGVAGLIKMVMALRHGLLPRSLHIDAPSPHVNWSAGAIRLLSEEQRWPDIDGRPRRAAVSSFGVSGTNSHLILEQSPLPAVPAPAVADGTPTEVLWPVSAKSGTALRAQAARLREHAAVHPHLDPVDVAHTLGTARSAFAHRAVVRGRTRDELLDGLRALQRQEDHPGLTQAAVPVSGPGKLVFVFPGQGSQWPGMGMELYDAHPAYRRALDAADEALRPHTGWSVVDVLRGAPGAPALDGVDVVHPALFAVMTSLARLWQSQGLVPGAVVGHSQGEIAAAHIAGALTLADAAKLVALRAQSLAVLSGTGAMATLGLPADRAQALVDEYAGDIGVAAVNSPASTVVAGVGTAVAELLRRCDTEGIRARRIDVEVAGHSPHIEPLHDDILERLADITPHPTSIAFHSTVDGRLQDGPLDGRTLTAAYWWDNLRNTVRLTDTVRSLADQGYRTFLECSPHPVLVPAVEETATAAGLVVGTLHRTQSQTGSLASAAARLHTHGHDLDFSALYAGARRVDLPTYAFEHRRHWLAQAPSAEAVTAGQRTTGHPLLGAMVDLPDDEGLLLTGRVGLDTHPWLADHAATGVALVPGTAYLDMVLHAADLAGCPHIAELTLHAPMVLPDEEALDLHLRVGPPDDHGHRPVTLHARVHTADTDPPAWTLHATARLTPQPAADPAPAGPAVWPPADARPVDLAGLRTGLAEAGYDYGPAFTGLRSVWHRDEHFYAEAELPDGLAPTGHVIHPALLDTALHPIALPDTAGERTDGRDGPRLPFTFSGITRTGTPARHLRVHLQVTKPDTVRVLATDGTGAPVLTIDALTLRATTGDHLRRQTATGPEHDLLHLKWSALPGARTGAPDSTGWALLDTDALLTEALDTVPRHAGLAALTATVDGGAAPPELVVWSPPARDQADAEGARTQCEHVLRFLQEWLADDRLTRTVLAVVTRHAVVTGPHDPPGLADGPVWGLLHTAQNENPGRIVLVDTDRHPDSTAALAAVLAAGHPQSALRAGKPYVPRLARTSTAELLTPPAETPAWRLESTGAGGLDRLALLPAPDATAPLRPGEVRVEVRAAAMNFVDTAAALGLIPARSLGAEAAGVVTETGPGVRRFAVGDRVTGLIDKAFGPVAVADQRLLTHVPDAWSFAQAAGVPVAFATAYHGLVDLADVRPGETVLIHAAAGGVGQAAVQLVRHLGATPLVTAHPDKWETLRALDCPDQHIASSRDLAFAERFREATGGRGVDVVLNCLAGSFVDASLDLLAPGGRFVELGKTDIRDTGHLATTHPHLTYQAFDLHPSAGPDRLSDMLAELLDLFRTRALTPLPVTAYGIRQAADAFRLMQNARHTGKLVLTFPRPPDPDGTVLITGGTGTLGTLLARHLVATHGVRHLLLASRRGPQADGADRLRADLEGAGAHVTITACDVADPHALRQLLDSVPAEHPLTGVFHTAGTLADATIANLTPDQFATAFAPKADAARQLHELTRHLDLAAFVLYSSTAATFGNPGQGNYVAANAFLDALAHHRRRQGLSATSMAWGWWQPVTGLSGTLTDSDNARIAGTGLAPITAEYGHALLDAALELPYPVLTASPLNQRTLRANSELGTLHPLLERLTAATAARRTSGAADSVPDLRQELDALAPEARLRRLRTLITAHAGAVLGLDASSPLPADQPFKASGFDSLTALELRNRLTRATALQLPATLTYDHPTPDDLAAHLVGELFTDDGGDIVDGDGDDRTATDPDAAIQRALASIPVARLRDLGLLETLLQLADDGTTAARHPGDEDIRSASADELVALALSMEESG
ncbi:type I polyketide synthase [Streptomyces scabiei]|uniref:type I polyketide synthase n=1 Tax=Streptomyces scabiei TaxID=1930 RepID=UPI001B31550F|nr:MULTISPECIES: type I polyketide synthase [Streptomyces]MBP5897533.1 SDR family NAD(P)-dependent oxidoreductase [Streptomyces sp. LBUM 1488]MDX3169400.1 type I polyketide synthase [Streptomyces scabiei]QTU44320.1 SDR family NAD(P)-dependent oxidoreductase [Streptomyces sp. LBUM 1482]